ncbi:MAG: hypothetical protein N2558_04885 [Patescibacteria group bacterium]|nr:hypothetical protein [Patescibacteria group bacterium]
MNDIRKKIKWADPVTLCEIPFIVSIGFLFISIKYFVTFDFKRFFIFVLLFLILSFISYLLLKHIDDNDEQYPGLLMENDFDGLIKIKTESDGIKCITKKDNLPIPVDGINTFIKNGKVYKVRSGTNVKINKDGTISEYSVLSGLLNKWVNIDDLPPEWKDLSNKKC